MFRSRAGRPLALAIAALAVVIVAGYAIRVSTASDRGRDVAQGLQSTLETLRDPWGFFVDPTYYDDAGSFYSTALIDTALGKPGPGAAAATDIAAVACASPEREIVGEPWFTWALVTVLGTADVPCSERTAPTRTGDPSTDIPQAFAWAQAMLETGVPRDQVMAAVGPVVEDGPGEVRSPYVMWRLDQLEEMLGLPSSAADRPAPAPAALGGPDDLTELWGSTMRCQAQPDRCPSTTAISDEAVAVAAVSYPDDLSLAGALAVLRARGATGYLQDLTRDVEARRAGETGLIRGARFVGTIDTTFTVLQLAPDLFPGAVPETTAAELLRRLELVPANDTVKRLRALAILRAVDPEGWQARRQEVDAAFAAHDGSDVSKDSFMAFLDVATAFGAMNVDAPTARLEIFEVRDAETEYLARLASAGAWALSNGGDVLEAYRDVRQAALARADAPHEPVAAYVAGLRSLVGPGISVSAERREAISRALDAGLRGCQIDGRRIDDLYRFNLDPASACSLTITEQLIASSFGGMP